MSSLLLSLGLVLKQVPCPWYTCSLSSLLDCSRERQKSVRLEAMQSRRRMPEIGLVYTSPATASGSLPPDFLCGFTPMALGLTGPPTRQWVLQRHRNAACQEIIISPKYCGFDSGSPAIGQVIFPLGGPESVGFTTLCCGLLNTFTALKWTLEDAL